MKYLVVVLGLITAVHGQCSVTTCSGSFAPTTYCAGDLIFEENFDELNFQKWGHESTLAGGGNWEFEWYTNNRSNSFVRDSVLYIKPTLTSDFMGEAALSSAQLDINGGAPADACTNPQFYGCIRAGSPTNILNPVRSARMRTVDSFAFAYGRIEIRAKLPAGDWLWPAIWMMPAYNAFGTWPTSGEIDIMESRGNKNLVQNGQNIGTQMVGSTLHWGPDYAHNEYIRTHWENTNAAGYDTDFHIYGVNWTPDFMAFSVDGVETGRVTPPDGGFWELGQLDNSGYANPWVTYSKMAPFDQQFYFILNNACGGIAYFPDDATNPSPKPWLNTSPQAATDFWNGRSGWIPTWNMATDDSAMQVDYVRVYAV